MGAAEVGALADKPPPARSASSSVAMRANCGSSRAAACESSDRAIKTTKVDENNAIRQTDNAFLSSILLVPLSGNAEFAAAATPFDFCPAPVRSVDLSCEMRSILLQ